MSSALNRLAILVTVAACAAAQNPPQADALSLFTPKPVAGPPAPAAIPPVAGPTSNDPAPAPARGTVIMVFGSGWAGHSAEARDELIGRPGGLFLQRGWRVVSIDYDEGADGLQDVLDAAGAELARKTGDGPLCIYGESSGAHLALLAASRLRAIDCVIGLGTPTDLARFRSEGAASDDGRVRLVAGQISRLFGSTPAELNPWDPVTVAPSIRADVLLVSEGDDTIVPVSHSIRFQEARPTTELVELEAGDPADAATRFVHGTASAGGRARYEAALGAFTDRAVAARAAARRAGRTGCAQANRSIGQITLKTLQDALRCLARSDPQTSGV
ncbi:MAG TPA: hypothetical protein VGV67_00680, partial [Solirubrobacteraceae bacterium]|nr:hypothetical protein [Solirubrobacteraceae bacterium]